MDNLVYKYRPDNENTEKIITDKTLWFSSPRDFNDPFDCWVNCAEPKKEHIQNIISNSNLPNSVKSMCLKGAPVYNKKMMKKDIDIVLSKILICCFSEVKDNILMWSHYADSHKGLCFQFDMLASQDSFSLVKKVEYVDSMPLYDDSKDRLAIIEKVIQPKAENWAYEKEVRIVKTPNMCDNGKNAISYNPLALKKIIFGCKTDKNTIEKYKRLCKEHGFQHVIFSQMMQNIDGKFELEEKNI